VRLTNFFCICLLTVALAGWIFSLPAHARTITGTTAGTVVDPSGAGVLRATGTFINQATVTFGHLWNASMRLFQLMEVRQC
jgi:hypothetical protein